MSIVTALPVAEDLFTNATLAGRWGTDQGISSFGYSIEAGDVLTNGDYKLTVVDAFTGREGGPEETWIVFYINDAQDVLYRYQGYYSSYDGTSWEGPIEFVEARPVTRTEYFRIDR